MAKSKSTPSTGAPTVSPSIPTSAAQLRRVLDDLDQVDSFVNLSVFSLRSQDIEIDSDIAAVLDIAYERVTDIRDRLTGVLATLEGSSHG